MAEGWTYVVFKIPTSPNHSMTASFRLKSSILPCSPVLGKPEFFPYPTEKHLCGAGRRQWRHCQESLCSPTPKGWREAASQSTGRADQQGPGKLPHSPANVEVVQR